MTFVLRRSAARVVCVNPSGELLLIRAHDPARPADGNWWEIPGGGIEPGESSEHAVARELEEEAGVVDARIGPVVATLRARFTFGGWLFDQDEVIHIAWTTGESSVPTRLETFEALAFEAIRWWPVDELLDSDVRTVPPRLRDVVRAHLLDRSALDGLDPAAVIDVTDHAANAAAW